MHETLAFYIVRLYKDFLRYTNAELKTLGLNFGQMPIILYIGKHPECTQSALTRDLKLDWGYSQRSIVKLFETDFIDKSYDSEKASNCLKLTPKGQEAFKLCHKVFFDWDEDKMQDFTSKEREELISLLAQISAEKEGIN